MRAAMPDVRRNDKGAGRMIRRTGNRFADKIMRQLEN
jgi:hypothetical protein